MNKYTLAANTIKRSVSALEVANALGWEIRHGRCKCPIHNGDGYNMKLYPDDRGYVCWVCKSGGDVIKLVQESECKGQPFKTVIAWFNITFNLGLDLDGAITPEKRRQAETAQRMRKNAIEFAEWKERTKFGLALAADQILEKLEECRDEHVPKTTDEAWDPQFCMAIRMIPAARRIAEDCMMDCVMCEKEC